MSKNQKLDTGITLLELLIAITLLALVMFAGSGIYLSGWNMFRDAQLRAQAARNALIPMMHIMEGIRQAASECISEPAATPDGVFRTLHFLAYDNGPWLNFRPPPGGGDGGPAEILMTLTNFSRPPHNHRCYAFVRNVNEIRYYANIDNSNYMNEQSYVVIGTHITNVTFTVQHQILVQVNIIATDNNGNNPYNLTSRAEARYSSVPPVYSPERLLQYIQISVPH